MKRKFENTSPGNESNKARSNQNKKYNINCSSQLSRENMLIQKWQNVTGKTSSGKF